MANAELLYFGAEWREANCRAYFRRGFLAGLMKLLRISCKTGFEESLENLHVLQGDLKDLSTENYEKLKNEILIEGFDAPFFTWQEPSKIIWILDGTQRFRVLTKMKQEGYAIPFLPIVPIIAKDIAEAKRKLLGYASQYGAVTSQGLYEFLSQANIEFDEFDQRYRMPEIKNEDFKEEFYEENKSSEGEDDIPEVQEGADKRLHLGDLYILGDHRLLCGDSTQVDSVSRLMNGEKADMVYTDPPYGMNLDTDYSTMTHKDGRSGNKFKPIEGDDKEFDPSHLLDMSDEVFLWGADYYCDKILKNGSWIVWDKRESERIGTKMSEKMFGSMFELCWSKKKHKKLIAKIMWAGGTGQGESEDRKGRNNCLIRHHPAMKPIELHEWFFSHWGKDKTNIVDLYLGSGSTLIACEKTKRKCYGMEIDPQYCEVIIERWQKFSGKIAYRQEPDGTLLSWDTIKGPPIAIE